MSDSVIDKLTRFTPTERLDRDELLFRAGRASAPGRRCWVLIAGLLASSQLTTLVLWYAASRPAETFPERSTPVAGDLHDDLRYDPDSFNALRTRWVGDDLPPPAWADPVPPEPPLTIQSVWSDPALK
jgi:hypothetical protein